MKQNTKAMVFGLMASAGLLMGTNASAADKSFDVRISPAVLLIGAVDIEAGMKVTDNLSVGPMFTYWGASVDSDELSIMAYGVRGDWHLNGSPYKSGPYISPYFKYWTFEVSQSSLFGGTRTGSSSATMFGAIGGYQWSWDTVQLKTGVGYSMGSVGDFTLKDSTGNTTTYSGSSVPIGGLAFDLSVGYTF